MAKQHAKAWDDFVTTYLEQVSKLNLPTLQLAYKDNLQAISAPATTRAQRKLFDQFAAQFAQLDKRGLSDPTRLDAALIAYELDLNLMRLELEEKWHSTPSQTITDAGLYQQKLGREWYVYFLKRWVDREATPDAVFDFGLAEISRVKARIRALQSRMQLNDETLSALLNAKQTHYGTPDEVKQAFTATQRKMITLLAPYFPALESVPPVAIKQAHNPRLSQVPGYYGNNTLWFNFFAPDFSKTQIEWLYLHEAIPGHHYQSQLARRHNGSRVQSLYLRYPGYIEGWAAYVEDVAVTLGAYSDDLSELGKWRWDLIRSVRVPLDVGINYFGWDDEQALAFWRKHILDQDAIGQREIKRIRRWPAQVVTYKYGASIFAALGARHGTDSAEEALRFHQSVLAYGTLPLSVLISVLSETLTNRD